METIDLKKDFKALYRAKETPEELRVPAGTFLAVDGKGEPGGVEYQEAIEALFSVAYTMKFALKGAGVLNFKIPSLECLWFSDPAVIPVSEWKWRLRIRVPDPIIASYVADACEEVRARKGVDVASVRRIAAEEETAVQVLHVGPYDTLVDSYRKLVAFAEERGLRLANVGHEVYLSDPLRTAPPKLKTIVRLPLA